MAAEHILQRVEALKEKASPHEAKHLHGNLLTLLKRGRSNKMSPLVKTVNSVHHPVCQKLGRRHAFGMGAFL